MGIDEVRDIDIDNADREDIQNAREDRQDERQDFVAEQLDEHGDDDDDD